jgi:CIC family chloride channel protein
MSDGSSNGTSHDSGEDVVHLRDFSANGRMLLLSMFAIGIGIVASFVAYALLKLIALFTNVFYYQTVSWASSSPAHHGMGPAMAVAMPIIGALIIGVMARYGSDKIRGHGIPEALESILTGGSKVSPKVALLKPISAAISIGSGGPFGAEGPIIMTGGAFGSLIAQGISLTAAERKTLLVAGAAAGMSATFATPLAAIMLGIEILLFEWKPRSFVPVALASATAAISRQNILGPGPLFGQPEHAYFVGTHVLVFCVAAGLGAGILSMLLTQAVYASEDVFKKLPFHWMWWPAIGGLVIGIGGLIAPRALGVGYDVIGDLLNENMLPKAVITLVIVKGLIWSISLGSGTSGGVLAPLLMMGSALGLIEAQYFPDGGHGFWPLVGLGAILGGTMRAPLTGILFAVELSHDMNMFVPLVIAVTTAHAFTVLILKRSILTEKVARRGFHVSCEYSIDDLEILFARDAMITQLTALPSTGSVKAAQELVGPLPDELGQHLFPITDVDGNLTGAITYRQLTDADPSATVGSIATPIKTVRSNQTLKASIQEMSETGVTRLVVVNPADPRKVVGVLSLHHVLKARTRHLQEEVRRERVLPFEYLIPRMIPLPRWMRPPTTPPPPSVEDN